MNKELTEQLDHILHHSGMRVEDIVPVTSDGSAFSIADAYAAKAKEMGFNIGSMCGDEPRALSKEATFIAKWRNIPSSDYSKLGGVILCEDGRDGKEAFIVTLTNTPSYLSR